MRTRKKKEKVCSKTKSKHGTADSPSSFARQWLTIRVVRGCHAHLDSPQRRTESNHASVSCQPSRQSYTVRSKTLMKPSSFAISRGKVLLPQMAR